MSHARHQNTRATVLHPDLKLKNQYFHGHMRHPVHGRQVKVFHANVKDFDMRIHADREVYYYKSKGHRMTVDTVLWLRLELQAGLSDSKKERNGP